MDISRRKLLEASVVTGLMGPKALAAGQRGAEGGDADGREHATVAAAAHVDHLPEFERLQG